MRLRIEGLNLILRWAVVTWALLIDRDKMVRGQCES